MRLNHKTHVLILLMAFFAIILSAQTVRFSVSSGQLKPGEKGVLRGTLNIPKELEKKQSYDPSEGEGSYFYLTGANQNLTFGKTRYPQADHISDAGMWEYYGPVTLSVPFVVNKNAKPGKISIDTEMMFGLCHKTNGNCDPPDVQTGKVTLEIIAGELPPDTAVNSEEDTLAVPAVTENKTTATPETAEKDASDTPKSALNIIYYMLLAVLGGIVLNFTPCVLPILPIRAMSMVNQAQKDVTKVLLHSLVYMLGVLISFGAIAAVIVIARLSGVNLTYGFLNGYLIYHLIMLSMLMLFGLSLMGVFEMTIPGMNAATKVTSKKGYAGSFFSGIFAFLMGFACMGPFMGPALEVAVRLSSPLLVLFFLLIGFGFALPFIIISLFPKALKYIPKPGEWMSIFKEVMGFVLLYLTWKYFSNIWGLTKSGTYLLDVAYYLVFLGFGAWLYGRFVRMEYSKWVQYIFTLLAIVVIGASAYTLLPWKAKHEPAKTIAVEVDGLTPAEHPGWYVFSAQTLDKLLKDGKPVFVDIGASWCTNCKVNMKNVLDKEDVLQAFKDKGVTLLYGDFTKQPPDLLKWITERGGAGVPFNQLYIPGKEPIKMSELFSKKDIFDALAQIPSKESK